VARPALFPPGGSGVNQEGSSPTQQESPPVSQTDEAATARPRRRHEKRASDSLRVSRSATARDRTERHVEKRRSAT
jgi:hypothetical protein